jgi:hypothetical protein
MLLWKRRVRVFLSQCLILTPAEQDHLLCDKLDLHEGCPCGFVQWELDILFLSKGFFRNKALLQD